MVDFNQGINLNPKNAIAYNNRGIAKERKGDLDGALADYNEAIQLDPKYAAAYRNRGNAKRKKATSGEPTLTPSSYQARFKICQRSGDTGLRGTRGVGLSERQGEGGMARRETSAAADERFRL